jgi:hypothetical protein
MLFPLKYTPQRTSNCLRSKGRVNERIAANRANNQLIAIINNRVFGKNALHMLNFELKAAKDAVARFCRKDKYNIGNKKHALLLP